MINWIKRKLGIDLIEAQVNHLSNLEGFTLSDVVSRLEESMIVVAGDRTTFYNLDLIVPSEKKNGIIFLGNHATINGGNFRPQKVKQTTEYLEDVPEYDSLSDTIINEEN